MWCSLSISLSRCKVKSLQEQMYLTHFIVKSPSVTNLRLTSCLVNVDIHGAIFGAHLIEDAFWCKAGFFTVIKFLQRKRFNSNCVLPITNYSVRCGMDIFRFWFGGLCRLAWSCKVEKLLGIRRWVRVGFSFSFLTVSVLIGGKLYDLLEFN